MPPVRGSRRLRRQDVEEQRGPYHCFICLTPITVNMYDASATPCCTRQVHRACYQQHAHTLAACGHCRRPFATQAAIDPLRNPLINEDWQSERYKDNRPSKIWKHCFNLERSKPGFKRYVCFFLFYESLFA